MLAKHALAGLLLSVTFLGAIILAACGVASDAGASSAEDLTDNDGAASDGPPASLQIQAEQQLVLGTSPQQFVFDGQAGWRVHYRVLAHDGSALHFIPHLAIQQADSFVLGGPNDLGSGLGDISGQATGDAMPLPNAGKWLVTVRAATDDETKLALKQANSSFDPKGFAKTGPYTLVLNVDLPCHHAGDENHKNPDNCPSGLFCTQLKDGWDWSKDKGAPQCMP
jgi:hypothetical protein